jgi:hypothetical protein
MYGIARIFVSFHGSSSALGCPGHGMPRAAKTDESQRSREEQISSQEFRCSAETLIPERGMWTFITLP